MPNQLRRLREAAGMEQADLAALLGEKTNTYGAWERSDNGPSLSQARRCAEALGCSIDEVAGYAAGADGLEAELVAAFRASDSRAREIVANVAKAAAAAKVGDGPKGGEPQSHDTEDCIVPSSR